MHKEVIFPNILKPTKLQWGASKAFIFQNFLAGAYRIDPPLQQKSEHHMSAELMNETEQLQYLLKRKDILQNTINTLPSTLQQIVGAVKTNNNGNRRNHPCPEK